MADVTIDDFYDALSYNWKTLREIKQEICWSKGIKHPNEVKGFFSSAYHMWKWTAITRNTPRYLNQLVDEGLAEMQDRSPTKEETAEYDRLGLP